MQHPHQCVEIFRKDRLISKCSPGANPICSTKSCGWQGNVPEEAGNQLLPTQCNTLKSDGSGGFTAPTSHPKLVSSLNKLPFTRCHPLIQHSHLYYTLKFDCFGGFTASKSLSKLISFPNKLLCTRYYPLI